MPRPSKSPKEAVEQQTVAGGGRERAMTAVLAEITKQFGEGAIMQLGQMLKVNVEVIPSGSLGLDIALGVMGIPRGRITEIYGPESSGKTSLCLHVIAEAQKAGGVCAFIDMEHALDSAYAKRLGVDLDKLYVTQPDTGEQAMEIAEALIRSGGLDVIIVDSVAALVPRAEIDGEMGDSHMGLQARLMSQALRKISGAVKQTNTILLFTNQLREKIGVSWGSPETTTGGRALKFWASIRMDIRRLQSIKKGEDTIGNRVKIKVTKNKVAAPFRECEFDLMFADGISKTGEMIDLGVELGIIDKKGAFFRYGDQLVGQGRLAAQQFLSEETEMADKIEAAIRKHYAKAGTPVGKIAEVADEPSANEESESS